MKEKYIKHKKTKENLKLLIKTLKQNRRHNRMNYMMRQNKNSLWNPRFYT